MVNTVDLPTVEVIGVRGNGGGDTRNASYNITFLTPSGTYTARCNNDQYILDAAEEAGIDLPYSCRAGSCSSCTAYLVSGQINQGDGSFLQEEQIQNGFVLLCVAYPMSDCIFKTHQEESLDGPPPREDPPVLTSKTDEQPNPSRRIIGVGEGITITSDLPVSWSVSSDLVTIDHKTSNTIHLSAKDRAGTVTVTANTGNTQSNLQISIIQPNGLKIEKIQDCHVYNVLDAGFSAKFYVLPANVNFYNIYVREVDSRGYGGIGLLEGGNGKFHGNYPDGHTDWFKAHSYESGVGTLVNMTDFAYGGQNHYCEHSIPYSFVQYSIPFEWCLDDNTSHTLVTMNQSTTIHNNGMITTQKGEASVTFFRTDASVGLDLFGENPVPISDSTRCD